MRAGMRVSKGFRLETEFAPLIVAVGYVYAGGLEELQLTTC